VESMKAVEKIWMTGGILGGEGPDTLMPTKLLADKNGWCEGRSGGTIDAVASHGEPLKRPVGTVNNGLYGT